MKSKPFVYDPYEGFRKNPRKLASFIKMYPKPERPLAEKAAKVMLSMSFGKAELAAQRAIKKAESLKELQKRFSRTGQKEDPYILIDVGPTGMEGSDPFPYVVSYGGVLLSLPQLAILEKLASLTKGPAPAGFINFTFPYGLPVGQYMVWVYWYPISGQQECKICCYSYSQPELAIKPSQGVNKSTAPDSYEYFTSGIDMFWEVVAPNQSASLCIKNANNECLACLGATLLGSY